MVDWDPAVLPSERCGMLFQQGVLIDTLTVAGGSPGDLSNHHPHSWGAPATPSYPASERQRNPQQDGSALPPLFYADVHPTLMTSLHAKAENIALSLGGAGLPADLPTIKHAVEMVGLASVTTLSHRTTPPYRWNLLGDTERLLRPL